jgi:predicted phosphate transport protein (TIGR00153 family)
LSEENYATWFAKRRESNVMDGAKGHILKVVDTCEEMDKAIMAILDKDNEKAFQAISRLDLNEKAADSIEVSLNEELAIGKLPSKEREDLMHLVHRIDQIADFTKSASRNIQVVLEAGIEVPEKTWKYFSVLANNVLRGAKEVKLCLDFLGEDEGQFLVHRKNVESIEHENDDLYFKIKKELVTSLTLSPRVMFIMRDIIHAMENATDNCKSAADYMHIILTANK